MICCRIITVFQTTFSHHYKENFATQKACHFSSESKTSYDLFLGKFTENDLNSNVLKVETFMVNRLLREKHRDLGRPFCRRSNLCIDGVKEAERESREDTEVKIQNIFRNQLGVQRQINIEREHRTGKARTEESKQTMLFLKKIKSLIL